MDSARSSSIASSSGIQTIGSQSSDFEMSSEKQDYSDEKSSTNISKVSLEKQKKFKKTTKRVTRVPVKTPIVNNCKTLVKVNASTDYKAPNYKAANFRKRKSHSMMDMQRSPSRASTISYLKNNSSGSNLRLHPVISSDGNTIENSFAISEEFYYMVHNSGQLESETDCKMAGMKIFASIMLNAWRRRRDDVKKLTEDLNRLKRGTIKTQNKLHVLSSLFKIERKNNESLKDQVHRLNSEKRTLQIAHEELMESNQDILLKNKLLEDQLNFKNEEIEAMNIVLEDTKSQLFHAMTQIRETDSLKCIEQRKVQELENQKNHLMSEFSKLKNEMVNLEKKSRKKRDQKDEEITLLKEQILSMEYKCSDILKKKENEIQELVSKEAQYALEECELKHSLQCLKQEIQNSFPNKLKIFLNDVVLPNGKTTLEVIHFLTYLLLPAFPPPSRKALPIKFDLKKTVDFFRSS